MAGKRGKKNKRGGRKKKLPQESYATNSEEGATSSNPTKTTNSSSPNTASNLFNVFHGRRGFGKKKEKVEKKEYNFKENHEEEQSRNDSGEVKMKNSQEIFKTEEDIKNFSKKSSSMNSNLSAVSNSKIQIKKKGQKNKNKTGHADKKNSNQQEINKNSLGDGVKNANYTSEFSEKLEEEGASNIAEISNAMNVDLINSISKEQSKECFHAVNAETKISECEAQKNTGIVHKTPEQIVSKKIDAVPSWKSEETHVDVALEEKNVKQLELLNQIENSPLTATIFVAAPYRKNHTLAITGEDRRLGKWKHPQGNFRPILKIKEELHIFEGIVPVPSLENSLFKFVHVDNSGYVEYEGDGSKDNRSDELLPESWNFFIFRPKIKSVTDKFWHGWTHFFSNRDTRKKIAAGFLSIAFQHTMTNPLSDWDDIFEFLDDVIQKIERQTDRNTSAGFKEFLNQWFQKPEFQNFDQLMLLTVGACKTNVYTAQLESILKINSKAFSIYLHNFRNLKRRGRDLVVILERIAINFGQDYSWILFRINRHTEIKESSLLFNSIIKTLHSIPEVLLHHSECAARVAEYLIKFGGDIDNLYPIMSPVFAKDTAYEKILNPLFLQKFLTQKYSIDDLTKILLSDWMKYAYQNISAKEFQQENDISQRHQSCLLFQGYIETIFNQQKVLDILKLACRTPEFMLSVVTPFVENVVLEKLKTVISFTKEEYHYFAAMADNDRNFDHFPQSKQQIEDVLLKMAMEPVKAGLFLTVPSLKLILRALAKIDNAPFLERANIVDLEEIMRKMPLKFFQNFHFALKTTGLSLEKTLKPYRKGVTRDVVDRIENHFDQVKEIISNIEVQRVSLAEISCLFVSNIF